MKRYSGITGIIICTALLIWSCEGPMGPAGQDINETCKNCHSSESGLTVKMKQASHSKHMTGEAWLEGTRNNCAPCHSNEGFHDVIKNNTAKQSYVASAAAIATQSPVSCGTCHKIHTNYDSTDFALTFTGGVDMLIDTARTRTLVADLGNSSNLCMKCHQPRIIKQMDFAGAPATNYTGITSFRFGPHYGTVGSIFAGKGAFEISGTATYSNSQHTSMASCATCHMADQNGLAGGHTFWAKNEETGAINTKGCTGCHSNSATLTTLITSTQNEISGLLEQLGAKLDEIGGANGGILEKVDGDYTGYVDIYDASSNSDAKYKTSSQAVALPNFPTLTNKQAAALVNFQLVLRDKSMGIHNYAYTKALLTNSLAAL